MLFKHSIFFENSLALLLILIVEVSNMNKANQKAQPPGDFLAVIKK